MVEHLNKLVVPDLFRQRMSLPNTANRPFTSVSHFGLDLRVRYFIGFLPRAGNVAEAWEAEGPPRHR